MAMRLTCEEDPACNGSFTALSLCSTDLVTSALCAYGQGLRTTQQKQGKTVLPISPSPQRHPSSNESTDFNTSYQTHRILGSRVHSRNPWTVDYWKQCWSWRKMSFQPCFCFFGAMYVWDIISFS